MWGACAVGERRRGGGRSIGRQGLAVNLRDSTRLGRQPLTSGAARREFSCQALAGMFHSSSQLANQGPCPVTPQMMSTAFHPFCRALEVTCSRAGAAARLLIRLRQRPTKGRSPPTPCLHVPTKVHTCTYIRSYTATVVPDSETAAETAPVWPYRWSRQGHALR